MCIFSPLSNTVYVWLEWMWRMSEQSGCGEYLKRKFISVLQKRTFMCFSFVLM